MYFDIMVISMGVYNFWFDFYNVVSIIIGFFINVIVNLVS